MKIAVSIAGREDFGTMRQQSIQRDRFQKRFRELLFAEPQLRGRVLDIGCGSEFPLPLRGIEKLPERIDGVDVSDAVMSHPGLCERWQSPLETAPIPSGSYDLAYAYNVLEHIPNPAPFLSALFRVLKPGGVFWALTPYGPHPFCRLSRSIEVLGGKGWFARRNEGVNDYPAYYRLNSIGSVTARAEEAGFASATFYRFPCVNWDTYFPSALKWLPHLYDSLLGTRISSCMQVLAFRASRPLVVPAAMAANPVAPGALPGANSVPGTHRLHA
jgi:SAM-dependent methyltransferase